LLEVEVDGMNATSGGGGGGGAGGFRTSCLQVCGATTYPIVVGAGGAGGTATFTKYSTPGIGSGTNSIFSTITSAGGGGGSNK
jgi:hypothetical protein